MTHTHTLHTIQVNEMEIGEYWKSNVVEFICGRFINGKHGDKIYDITFLLQSR